jgi:hypothetical protein
MVDIAESKLHEAVERGEWRAVRYTLSTLGRDRGYTTKPLPLQDPFADQDADAAFQRALDLAYGKRDPDQEPDCWTDDAPEEVEADWPSGI